MSETVCEPLGMIEIGGDALRQRRVASRAIGVARRKRHGGEHRDDSRPWCAVPAHWRACHRRRWPRIDLGGGGVAAPASMPSSPVYHWTVFAAGAGDERGRGRKWRAVDPLRRIARLKKSFAAATAEAAVSDVDASVLTPPVSADCRLVAVAAGVAPMVNWPEPGGEAVVAVERQLLAGAVRQVEIDTSACRPAWDWSQGRPSARAASRPGRRHSRRSASRKRSRASARTPSRQHPR